MEILTIVVSLPGLLYVHMPQTSTSLKDFLSSYDQLPLDMAHRLIVAITRVIKEAHDNQRVIGNVDVTNIVVFQTGVSNRFFSIYLPNAKQI